MAYLGSKSQDMAILLANLIKLGPETAVITDGKNGAYAARGNNGYFCSIVENKPVETTGAGDSFATGFAGAIMSGRDIPEALKWGAINASSVVSQIGPQKGLLNIAQIENGVKASEQCTTKEFSI